MNNFDEKNVTIQTREPQFVVTGAENKKKIMTTREI